jgi:hypothetical protein
MDLKAEGSSLSERVPRLSKARPGCFDNGRAISLR